MTSRTATVTVRTLPAPTGLVATTTGTSSVSISRNASTHHYVLERKANGSGFLPVQSVYNATSFNHTGRSSDTTYIYRVRGLGQ